MREKLKQTKGITLIALIITIIVLLILAMVSIRLIMNDGIIEKAEKATTDYSTAEEKEQIQLGYSEYQMAKAQGETNPTLIVTGATVTGDETTGWTITFAKTGNRYTLSSTGTIGKTAIDEIKDDILANKETYLAKAAEAGQNIESNADIGIGEDRSIVNLDYWSYQITNNEVTIRGYGSGTGSNDGSYKGPIINGEIVGEIPAYIYTEGEVLEVTQFGAYNVFGMNQQITKVKLPNTIKIIGEWAFCNCSTLQSITMANNLTAIQQAAFWGCSGLKSIDIPNTVTSIDDGAFGNCTNLTEIKIDNTEGTISGAPWGAPSTTKITYLR